MYFVFLILQRWEEKFKTSYTKGVKQIGNIQYSKTALIAKGSNGAQIFLGKVGSNNVAVKRIQSEFATEEVNIHNIIARKGEKLGHVITTVAIETDNDFTYLATPLCEYNLQELIASDNRPIHINDKYRIQMCRDLLNGLSELHEIGILHRDIKPNNVLYGKNWR